MSAQCPVCPKAVGQFMLRLSKPGSPVLVAAWHMPSPPAGLLPCRSACARHRDAAPHSRLDRDCLPRSGVWSDRRWRRLLRRSGKSPRRGCRYRTPVNGAVHGSKIRRTLHREAGPLSGFHLYLLAHVRTATRRNRNTTPFRRQPALSSPNDRTLEHRNPLAARKLADPKLARYQTVKIAVTSY